MQSESINELAEALVAAQGEFSAVPKGSVNPFFKSKYAALPDVVASASPVLAKHGLAVTQFVSDDDTLTTYLIHKSGQFIAHRAELHLVKDDPQSVGSAVTYQRRYSYMSCLGLVADDDDDGNAASAPRTRREATTPNVSSDGELDPRIDAILRASQEGGDNEFLNSLATQFVEKGSLTEKQIESGFKTASRLISTPRSAPVPSSDTPFFDEEPF
jgi:hypothetical protein